MVKVGLRYVLEGRQFELLGDRGIVHENVDSAKVLDGGADHDPHLILRSDVDAESRRFKSDPRQFLDAPLRFANIRDHDPGALCRELLRHRQTEPVAVPVTIATLSFSFILGSLGVLLGEAYSAASTRLSHSTPRCSVSLSPCDHTCSSSTSP
jgi:hypothetical protein